MEGSVPIRVVILYLHPLLGEGLARLLAAEPGVTAAAISEGDPTAAANALASRPDVVIVERDDRFVSSAMLSDAAMALLLFVGIGGAAGAPGIEGTTNDPERVVRAVRDLRRARMPLVTA